MRQRPVLAPRVSDGPVTLTLDGRLTRGPSVCLPISPRAEQGERSRRYSPEREEVRALLGSRNEARSHHPHPRPTHATDHTLLRGSGARRKGTNPHPTPHPIPHTTYLCPNNPNQVASRAEPKEGVAPREGLVVGATGQRRPFSPSAEGQWRPPVLAPAALALRLVGLAGHPPSIADRLEAAERERGIAQ